MGQNSPPQKKTQRSCVVATSMMKTAIEKNSYSIMAHFMSDYSSLKFSLRKSGPPTNASIKASVTTKNSLRSACMERPVKLRIESLNI